MMSHHQHLRSSNSSPLSSSSSLDDMLASERFFAPDYVSTDIKTWRSGLKTSTGAYPSMQPNEFAFGSTTPVPSHNGPATSRGTLTPVGAGHRVTAVRLGKRGSSMDSTASELGTMNVIDDSHISAPPSKRVRKELPSGRVQGACTRCKRLKMKCTFADNDVTCARCIVGGHECVVLGRKPRSPGVREILRKQIREKDAMIDNLLAQLNPTAPSATPLSLNVARLALTPEQRAAYRDVLSYFEKSQGVRTVEKKIDVSTLDEDSEYESDSDNGDAEGGDADDSASSVFQPHVPTKSAPAGLLAKTALETRSRSRLSSPAASSHDRTESEGSEETPATEAGVGNPSYFEPGPSSNLDLRRLIIERQAAPDILLSGLVTNEDVPKLFDIYWRWINPVMPILDENIHTPASVLGRCPFLFTVVCALASRFYDEKPEMYTLAIHLAKTAAANAFLDGWKTVEMCQAYALMASYMPPARRWDEDRSRFYSGIAIRLAIDLDLYRLPEVMPSDERGERELLNRLRTFITIYISDRGTCLNLGKPFMVPEVELIRSVNTMFNTSKYKTKADSYLASLVELYRIMTRYIGHVNPAVEPQSTTMTESEIIATQKVFDEELSAWEAAAAARCVEEEKSKDLDDRLRMGLMQLTYQYCRLVTFSAGLQRIMTLGKVKEDKVFFPGCLHAASAIIKCIIDRVLPTGFVRYSPEHVFALSAFGTAVLMKCLRPEFSSKLARPQHDRILDLVKRLIQALGQDHLPKPSHAEDQTTPRRCYARFLQQLLTTRLMSANAHQSPVANVVVTVKAAEPTTPDLSMDLSPDDSSTIRQTPEPISALAAHCTAHTHMHMEPHVHAHAHTHVNVKALDFAGHDHNNAQDQQDLAFGTWDMVEPHNELAASGPLLGFSETEYMQAFMAFPDQTWFMQ